MRSKMVKALTSLDHFLEGLKSHKRMVEGSSTKSEDGISVKKEKTEVSHTIGYPTNRHYQWKILAASQLMRTVVSFPAIKNILMYFFVFFWSRDLLGFLDNSVTKF